MKESELSANVTFTYATANRWLGVRFDLVVWIVSFSATTFSMFMRNMLPVGVLIFSLTIVTDISVNFSIAMRYFVEM